MKLTAKNISFTTASAVFAILPFAFILSFRMPSIIGEHVRSGLFTPFLLASVTVLLMRLPGWFGRWLPTALVLGWFAVPLAWLWSSGYADGMLLGGLLPFSDPSGYLADAHQLVHGHKFSWFSTQRPLFTALLSSLLALTGSNLQLVLAILVAFVAIALFLTTLEVRLRFGGIIATVFLYVSFLFFRRFIGSPMTENFGLALGAPALFFLLHGACTHRQKPVILGLFFLSMALCARAGAFFVLPAIVVWGAFRFRNERWFSRKFLVAGTVAVVAAFALNHAMVKAIGDPRGIPFGNFVYSAYGLVHGGTWEDAYKLFGNDKQQIIDAIIERLSNDPASLLRGIGRAWKAVFLEGYAFNYVRNPRLNIALLFLSMLGLTYAVIRIRRERYSSLILFCFAGLIASVPFAPPWDSDSMRAYAATMPMQIFIAALGTLPLTLGWEFVARKIRSTISAKQSGHSEIQSSGVNGRQIADSNTICLGFGTLLVILAVVFPLGLRVMVPAQSPLYDFTGSDISADTLPKGGIIHLVRDSWPRPKLPYVHISDFRQGLKTFAILYPNEAAALAQIPAGATLFTVFKSNSLAVIKTRPQREPAHQIKLNTHQVGFLKIFIDTELQFLHENSRLGAFPIKGSPYPVLQAGDSIFGKPCLTRGLRFFMEPFC